MGIFSRIFRRKEENEDSVWRFEVRLENFKSCFEENPNLSVLDALGMGNQGMLHVTKINGGRSEYANVSANS